MSEKQTEEHCQRKESMFCHHAEVENLAGNKGTQAGYYVQLGLATKTHPHIDSSQPRIQLLTLISAWQQRK